MACKHGADREDLCGQCGYEEDVEDGAELDERGDPTGRIQ